MEKRIQNSTFKMFSLSLGLFIFHVYGLQAKSYPCVYSVGDCLISTKVEPTCHCEVNVDPAWHKPNKSELVFNLPKKDPKGKCVADNILFPNEKVPYTVCSTKQKQEKLILQSSAMQQFDF